MLPSLSMRFAKPTFIEYMHLEFSIQFYVFQYMLITIK